MNAPLTTAVSQAIAGATEAKKQRMTVFAEAICRMRDEAIKGRQESGIELTWMECEEAYLGIDDENRDEFRGAAWAKPTSMEGPLTKRRSNSSNEGASSNFGRNSVFRIAHLISIRPLPASTRGGCMGAEALRIRTRE